VIALRTQTLPLRGPGWYLPGMSFPFILAMLLALPASGDFLPPFECSPAGASPRIQGEAACVAKGGLLPNLSDFRDSHCRHLPISVLKEQELLFLFLELASQKEIPFRFLQDGCQARAHRMAQILEEKGISSAKLFVRGRFAEIRDPLWPIRWHYHVAPVIGVHRAGRVDLAVLDPSLFGLPVSPEVFLERLRSMSPGRVDEAYLSRSYVYEWNHRELDLTGYRPEDLACMENTLETGRMLEELLGAPAAL
jgi:hypothetical protein